VVEITTHPQRSHNRRAYECQQLEVQTFDLPQTWQARPTEKDLTPVIVTNRSTLVAKNLQLSS